MGLTGRKHTSMKRIAILQSNYIPWKGYFDIINSTDQFIIYDDAQYTRRDWRNRNLIKTKNGLKWLTIPVEVKGRYKQKINETRIADYKWASKHWRIISDNYKKAPYFPAYSELFEDAYFQCSKLELLSDVNLSFINLINSILGIKSIITNSSKYQLAGDKTHKILDICKQENANAYLSGPAAMEYLNVKLFTAEQISVIWADYKSYPEYKQQYPPFNHGVSIIDLIFNCGKNSNSFMKSF